jgi:hypothetical protein
MEKTAVKFSTYSEVRKHLFHLFIILFVDMVTYNTELKTVSLYQVYENKKPELGAALVHFDIC